MSRASYLVFSDLDKDGVTDLFLGVLNVKSELTMHEVRVFKGKLELGKLSFKEQEKAVEVGPQSTAALALLDFDIDGNLDLFMGNWFKQTKEGATPQIDLLLKAEKTF